MSTLPDEPPPTGNEPRPEGAHRRVHLSATAGSSAKLHKNAGKRLSVLAARAGLTATSYFIPKALIDLVKNAKLTDGGRAAREARRFAAQFDRTTRGRRELDPDTVKRNLIRYGLKIGASQISGANLAKAMGKTERTVERHLKAAGLEIPDLVLAVQRAEQRLKKSRDQSN